MSGAVDFDKCPGLNGHGRVQAWRTCQCGKCIVCGYPKHSAVHGPFKGKPPGSEPFDHEFKPLHPTGSDSEGGGE